MHITNFNSFGGIQVFSFLLTVLYKKRTNFSAEKFISNSEGFKVGITKNCLKWQVTILPDKWKFHGTGNHV